jgi:polyhydroxybutyrate depolymerase
LNYEADAGGFIIVYPNGIGRLLTPLRRTWNGGYCCGVAYEKNTDDVGFIRKVIKIIGNEFSVNASRIYVTGHSNGGILTYRVGAELADIVAAIAPVAGTIGGRPAEDDPLYVIPEPNRPVSVVHFHGKLDENVPYDGGRGNRSRTPAIDLSVNESISFWVQHNGCEPVPEVNISESGNIITSRYTNGREGTEVLLYTIVNGGHGWPGSATGDRPTQEISATECLWDFFRQHPKAADPPKI